jgi:purine-binding chemotaxis protein CheW
MNATPSGTRAGPQSRYLVFSIADSRYAVSVMCVREILRLCPITSVPRMPPHMQGVINLRGTVVPVIDLRQKLGIAPAPYGARNCIIVMQLIKEGGKRLLLGAVVDGVDEVSPFAVTDIESTPNFGGIPDTRFIQGIISRSDGIRILLDMTALFADEFAQPLPVSESPSSSLSG